MSISVQEQHSPLVTVKDASELTNDWRLWDVGYATGAILARKLQDERYVAVVPFLFSWAVVVGNLDDPFFFEDRWCYERRWLRRAVTAARLWDGEGEPEGWYQHPASGRHRPDGDPSREYILR